jgi:glycosyltransferase 2 family protein
MQGSIKDRLSWKWLIRLCLLAGVVWLIATQVHPAEVGRALAQVKVGYVLALVFFFSPLAVLLRSMRWRYLLAEGNRIPLFSFVGAYIIGVLTNSLLLGKFGDLVKAKLICRSEINYERSLVVVVIDRLLEGIALLLVFFFISLRVALPAWAYRLAWTAGLVSVVALIGFRGVFHYRERFLEKAGKALGLLPSYISDRLLRVIHRLVAGCEVLTDHRRLVVALLYSLSVWVVEVVTVMMFLAAFSVPAPRVLSAIVILVFLNFGTLVPISPGAIGVYQLLCAFALSLWGVDRQLGLALGIAMQAVLFIPLYATGLIWMLVLTRNRSKEQAWQT